jgi:hypothetical protein
VFLESPPPTLLIPFLRLHRKRGTSTSYEALR